MNINYDTHIIEFPILYKKDNRTRVWKIFIRLIKNTDKQIHDIDWDPFSEIQIPIKESYLIGSLPEDIIAQYWTETGYTDGKITKSMPTYAKSKNINKKSFRHSLNQAIFEANSKINKKKTEGFIEENILESKYDPYIFPMLAKPYKLLNKFPVFCQPKLDGLRCICFINPHTNQVVMQSRTKKNFPNNKSNNEIRLCVEKLLENFPPNTYLDGELYNHDTKLQTLNHYIRDSKDTADSFILEYHIYDVVIDFNEPFKERYRYLENIKPNQFIKTVYTKCINNIDSLDIFYKDCINKGYEGIMIRDPVSPYFNKRSDALLKRKEVFTSEYPIVNYTCGNKGKDLNAIIWICKTSEEKEFKVTPNLSYKERYDLYKECNSNFTKTYKHRLLMVEYRALSIDNIPLHGKGILIRDIE